MYTGDAAPGSTQSWCRYCNQLTGIPHNFPAGTHAYSYNNMPLTIHAGPGNGVPEPPIGQGYPTLVSPDGKIIEGPENINKALDEASGKSGTKTDEKDTRKKQESKQSDGYTPPDKDKNNAGSCSNGTCGGGGAGSSGGGSAAGGGLGGGGLGGALGGMLSQMLPLLLMMMMNQNKNDQPTPPADLSIASPTPTPTPTPSPSATPSLQSLLQSGFTF